jgi:hypothetical protein
MNEQAKERPMSLGIFFLLLAVAMLLSAAIGFGYGYEARRCVVPQSEVQEQLYIPQEGEEMRV